MSLLRKLTGGLRALLHKKEVEQELEDELRGYMESATKENMKAGMSPEEAMRRVRMSMGSPEGVKEEVRGVGWENLLETIWQDLRFAARMLRKSPGFTAVAVLTLALGIGANTAIFSVINAVLLSPLPYPHSDRLVWLSETNQSWGQGEIPVPPPTFLDWQRQQHIFSALSAISEDALTLTGYGEPVRLQAADVSAHFFSLMETPPAMGRDFLSSDDRAGAAPVVILSDKLWREQFSGDPHIVGRVITLDDKGFTVVGVAPPGFSFPKQVSLWTPVIPRLPRLDPDALSERGAHYLAVIGRLAAGETLAAASANINAIEGSIAEVPANYYQGFRANLIPLKQRVVGDVTLPLWTLLAAVGFVLLIACANVANLVLARSAIRQKEIGIRRALGATGARLARQLLTESLLVAFFGGLAGLLLAYSGLHVLLAVVPQNLPRVGEIQLNGQVLLFAVFLSALAGAVFGLVPAWKVARSDPAGALKSENTPLRARPSHLGNRVAGRTLAVAEIAVTLILLAGASLMLKSFLRLVNVNPGFSPRNVIAFQLSLDTLRYPNTPLQVVFFDNLLRQTQALPGVQSAALGKDLPMLQSMSSVVSVNGHPWTSIQVQQATVEPEYFHTLRIPLIRGRVFNAADDPNSQSVAIVNEAFVHQLVPDGDPLGQTVETHFVPIRKRQIVGVVGDVHQVGPATLPPPEVYIPFAQAPNSTMTLLVRTESVPQSVIPAVKGIFATLDKDQAIDKIAMMESLLAQSVAQPRFYTVLLSIFAILAVTLALIGAYGVISYSVAQRTHEIGVRTALGAQPRDILRMVIREGMMLAGLGIIIGIAGALALTRFLASLLFEIKPTDPATFIGAAILLVLVALAACYIPARRAMRVDPLVALRYE